MDTLTGHPSSLTSKPPILDQWPAWWISSLVASRANHTPQPDDALAKASSGCGVWLAREATSDEIHQAGHWSKIGGFDVSDDGCPVKVSIFYPLLYDMLAVGVYLNVPYVLGIEPG